MIGLWGGPVALSVFIPMPRDSKEGSLCRTQVLSYIQNTIQQLDSPPPLAVSLLYSNVVSPILKCELKESTDGVAAGYYRTTIWANYFDDREYIDIYDAEYPTGTLRQLALDLV